MPIYPYECSSCQHTLEDLAGYNDPVLVMCPRCKTNNLKRVFGVPVNSEIKTIGGLADKNAKEFSEEKKQELLEKYRSKNNQKQVLNKEGWKIRHGNQNQR